MASSTQAPGPRAVPEKVKGLSTAQREAARRATAVLAKEAEAAQTRADGETPAAVPPRMSAE